MAEHSVIHDFGGEHSLTFYTGELPADPAVQAAGHEPNGYFWDGVAAFAAPDAAARLEMDSEAGMFCARGPLEALQELKAALEPILGDPAAATGLIARAEAAGFEFDD